MTRAVVICLTTGTATLPVVNHTHARIKETTDFRLTAIIGHLGHDLYDGAALYFFRTENPKLNSNNRFNFGVWTY
jgi:hypothetical protein